MNYDNIIKTLKDIPIEKRIISTEYDLGDNFKLEKNGDMYFITIQKGYNNQSPEFIFSSIMKNVNGIERGTPKTLQLGWEQSLEMLYHHYPMGYDNNSNCVLFNNSNKILAIQYNNLIKTNFLKTDCLVVPDYIVINNKKKLQGIYNTKEYNNLIPLLKKICAE